jgi:hypothetical protein
MNEDGTAVLAPQTKRLMVLRKRVLTQPNFLPALPLARRPTRPNCTRPRVFRYSLKSHAIRLTSHPIDRRVRSIFTGGSNISLQKRVETSRACRGLLR